MYFMEKKTTKLALSLACTRLSIVKKDNTHEMKFENSVMCDSDLGHILARFSQTIWTTTPRAPADQELKL